MQSPFQATRCWRWSRIHLLITAATWHSFAGCWRVKGRAKTSNAVLGFVFGLPNGVAWNVLSFWQCYYRIRTPNSSGLGGPDDTHWRTGPW